MANRDQENQKRQWHSMAKATPSPAFISKASDGEGPAPKLPSVLLFLLRFLLIPKVRKQLKGLPLGPTLRPNSWQQEKAEGVGK